MFFFFGVCFLRTNTVSSEKCYSSKSSYVPLPMLSARVAMYFDIDLGRLARLRSDFMYDSRFELPACRVETETARTDHDGWRAASECTDLHTMLDLKTKRIGKDKKIVRTQRIRFILIGLRYHIRRCPLQGIYIVLFCWRQHWDPKLNRENKKLCGKPVFRAHSDLFCCFAQQSRKVVAVARLPFGCEQYSARQIYRCEWRESLRIRTF